MTKLTLGEAAKESKRSKATISKAIKSGRLSAHKRDDGAFEIDPAELFRVFPPKETQNRVEPIVNTRVNTDLAIEIGQLRAELDAQGKINQRLEAEVDDLKGQRDKWEAQATAQTRLLENQTGQGRDTRGLWARIWNK